MNYVRVDLSGTLPELVSKLTRMASGVDYWYRLSGDDGKYIEYRLSDFLEHGLFMTEEEWSIQDDDNYGVPLKLTFEPPTVWVTLSGGLQATYDVMLGTYEYQNENSRLYFTESWGLPDGNP